AAITPQTRTRSIGFRLGFWPAPLAPGLPAAMVVPFGRKSRWMGMERTRLYRSRLRNLQSTVPKAAFLGVPPRNRWCETFFSPLPQASVSTPNCIKSSSQAPLGNASAEAPLRERLWARTQQKQAVGPPDEAELRPARSQAELGNEMR